MKDSSAVELDPSLSPFGLGTSTRVLDPRDSSFLVIHFHEKANFKSWAHQYKNEIMKKLVEHGVVYLRDFEIPKEELVSFVESLLPPNSLVDSYSGGVTGRPKVDRALFLTTVVPPENSIALHHEMSYLPKFPKKIFFYSQLPAEHGGGTPVSFSRRIKKDINPLLFAELKRRGVCYIRNYYKEAQDTWKVLLSWQKAFEVKTKEELEIAAKKQGFEFEWTASGGLRTKNVRPATVVHPLTGEEFLFNHAAILHTYSENDQQMTPFKRGGLTSLDPEERKLLQTLPKEDQPYLAAWGDTREIMSNEIIEELFQVYNKNKITLNWKKGDLMIIDNILAAHGRDPFIGARETFAILSNE